MDATSIEQTSECESARSSDVDERRRSIATMATTTSNRPTTPRSAAFTAALDARALTSSRMRAAARSIAAQIAATIVTPFSWVRAAVSLVMAEKRVTRLDRHEKHDRRLYWPSDVLIQNCKEQTEEEEKEEEDAPQPTSREHSMSQSSNEEAAMSLLSSIARRQEA